MRSTHPFTLFSSKSSYYQKCFLYITEVRPQGLREYFIICYIQFSSVVVGSLHRVNRDQMRFGFNSNKTFIKLMVHHAYWSLDSGYNLCWYKTNLSLLLVLSTTATATTAYCYSKSIYHCPRRCTVDNQVPFRMP